MENQFLVMDPSGFYEVSKKGLNALEPYKVKRAIIFAAGFGERLMPLTYERHKSLLVVKGKPIITYLLDALVAVGIDDITIVRGYLREQFDFLKKDYPSIAFIDNPIYATSKNITSAFLVRDKFSQSYIIEGDILLKNPLVIKKYEYHTHFKTIHVERSETWCFKLLGSKIKEYKLGGENVHETSGLSFWAHNDAESAFNSPGGKERFWDDVPLILFKDHYSINTIDCKIGDLIELRSVAQLDEEKGKEW